MWIGKAEEMNKEISMKIKDIFSHRYFIMGLSMVWIMFFHADFNVDNTIISHIKDTGYGGVDVFLMCSGFGCFCSLEKNNDVLTFINKRFVRIMPSWIIYMLFWIPATWLVRGISLQAVLGNLFCIQSLTTLGNSMNWYISAIWIFYILSPYLHAFCKKLTLGKNLLLLLIMVTISIPFWGVTELIVGVSRLAVFYLGMLLAKHQNYEISFKNIVVSLGGCILGFSVLIVCMHYFPTIMWSHALYWYPFIFIVFGIGILATFLECLLSKCKLNAVNNLINYIGRVSFEIYLIQVLYFNVIRFVILKNVLPNSNIIWLFALITTIPISAVFHFMVGRIMILVYRR